MASLHKWTELLLAIFLALVAFSPIPETTCVSYPLQKQGLLPAGKKVGTSLNPSIKSKKKKKSLPLPSTKNAEAKYFRSQRTSEDKIDDEIPTYKAELHDNKILASPPLNPKLKVDKVEDSQRRKPYYDCPLFTNDNSVGDAIIKPDPYDCGCMYYCNWGVHYVQCCSWPLLWNDNVKSCDWYWKVQCETYDGWDDK